MIMLCTRGIAVHSGPGSQPSLSWQVSEQHRSVPFAAPSSQASPGSMMPSTHRSTVQSDRQPSPRVSFPSSHASPWSTTPLPHVVSALRKAVMSSIWSGVIWTPPTSWPAGERWNAGLS